MPGRKLIVIIDGGPHGDRVAEWQRRALATLCQDDEMTLLVCTNTQLARRPLRLPLYYLLNLQAVRNPLTRSVALVELIARVTERIEFASERDGTWQVLPRNILDRISGSGAVAVIKLGMGLLRVPPDLSVPILSWHHGDPEHFRGRPAGFWEILTGHPVLGQMVQVIGNRLDAGRVVAFAETRIVRHSWRATLVEAFRHSPLLLGPALDNVASGRSLVKLTTGQNYRLPGNRQVMRLLLQLVVAKLTWLTFGALFEKRWRVSRAPVGSEDQAVAIASGRHALALQDQWWTPSIPDGCSFIADPFFGGGAEELLVEALSKRTGRGEIHRLDSAGSTRLSDLPGHYSYPALVEHEGTSLCIPEIAQWSTPVAYRWQGEWTAQVQLDIAGNPRLTDPTFLHHDGQLYLFANDAASGSGVLRLWSASGLSATFTEHPASPLRISPRGSRMGGNLMASGSGSQLIRLGQDGSRDYGDGLIAFAIDELTPRSYREREIGALRFSDRKGPHTFNLAPGGRAVVFDWYRVAFTPLAGIRRLAARLARR